MSRKRWLERRCVDLERWVLVVISAMAARVGLMRMRMKLVPALELFLVRILVLVPWLGVYGLLS